MRIGLISDAHGNLPAVEKGYSRLEECGVDRVFYLGDAVGYIPGTRALEYLFEKGIPCLKGNHEGMLLGELDGGDNVEVYRLPRPDSLSPNLRGFLQAMPDSILLEEEEVLLVHGDPENPLTGYLYPDADLRKREDPFRWVVMGHTHRPFVRFEHGTGYLNAGSCAFPRDGLAMGSVAVIDLERSRASIERFGISSAVDWALGQEGLHPVTRNALEKLSGQE